MKERFWNWFKKKEHIARSISHPGFHEREIWFAFLGKNIGAEQDGAGKDFIRPVVIIRKFNNDIFWVVPLTRTIKNLPFYFSFSFGEGTSTAMLSQIRLVDVRRLSNKIGVMKSSDFILLKLKFKALLP